MKAKQGSSAAKSYLTAIRKAEKIHMSRPVVLKYTPSRVASKHSATKMKDSPQAAHSTRRLRSNSSFFSGLKSFDTPSACISSKYNACSLTGGQGD